MQPTRLLAAVLLLACPVSVFAICAMNDVQCRRHEQQDTMRPPSVPYSTPQPSVQQLPQPVYQPPQPMYQSPQPMYQPPQPMYQPPQPAYQPPAQQWSNFCVTQVNSCNVSPGGAPGGLCGCTDPQTFVTYQGALQ